MSITEIQEMDMAERLRTMVSLWDAICNDKDEPNSPDWHEGVLNERRERIDSGDARFLSMDELKERLHK